MSQTKHAVEFVKWTHGLLEKMITGTPEDKWLHQPTPTANHVLWTMGHLATTYAWLCSLLDANYKNTLPDSYNGLFGMGSKPAGDKAKYPAAGEVRKAYNATFGSFLGLVEKLSDKDAFSPTASDSQGFASSKIDAAYKCAWHDGWHLGQIADVRRALGLPSVF